MRSIEWIFFLWISKEKKKERKKELWNVGSGLMKEIERKSEVYQNWRFHCFIVSSFLSRSDHHNQQIDNLDKIDF